MPHSLRLRGTVLYCLCKWLPGERITRLGSLAWLVTGMYVVIAVAYRRPALPLIWSVHRCKWGTVPSEVQIALLRKPVPLMPPQTEVWLVGDAGFGRAALMRWRGTPCTCHWWYATSKKYGKNINAISPVLS